MSISARLSRVEAKIAPKSDDGARIFQVVAAKGDRAAAIEFARQNGCTDRDWLLFHAVVPIDGQEPYFELPYMLHVDTLAKTLDKVARSCRRIWDRAPDEQRTDPRNPEFVRWRLEKGHSRPV